MSENGNSTALATVPAPTAALELSAKDAERKLLAIRAFQNVVHKTFIAGHDYGVIPGTQKPTLLKPGAEKIAKLLNLQDDYDIVEKIENWEDGFFYYLIRCRLTDIASGTLISSGLGSCNSKESRYAYRWVASERIPPMTNKDGLESRGGKKVMFEPDFSLNKKETTGKYGKPASYWESFAAAIADKRAVRKRKKLGAKEYDGYELTLDSIEYRVPNPDICDQVNTMLKIAKKRSLVDVALSVGRLSDLFTQDLEDIMGPVEEAPPIDLDAEVVKDDPAPEAKEEEPHKPEEVAPISEETKNEIAALVAAACAGNKRTTEKVLGQIRERVKFAFNHDLKKVPDDLTQDEAVRVIQFLKALK
jgi:hypothetical protein